MLTIITKFLPATNYRRARIKAFHSCNSSLSVTIGFPHDKTGTDAHAEALKAYCKKYGIEHTKWVEGGNNREYFWVAMPNWYKPIDITKE